MSYVHETSEEKRKRIHSLLCGEELKNNAQMALDEISRYILGEDWYTSEGMCNFDVNAIIVFEIETMLRENKSNVKKRKIKKKINKLNEKI